ALQPISGSSAVDAAAQLIEIHRGLLESERFNEACSLYRAEFAGQLAGLAGHQGPCEETLYEAFVVQTDEAFAAAEALGEMPLTPAFFVPSAIAIDTTQITADEAWLAYVPSSALTSLDTTEFRDGSGLTPAWLARSIYVQQGDDDIWRFAAAAERDNRTATG
ncbi:MAG: hypothetical protein GX862_01670, partial [Leucobacter sp.]|nr:hypothetical protein [Leucobacter sp.]